MSIQITEDHTYVDGYRIAFREQGGPVILIHRRPTNNLMWRAIMPQLALRHRVIAPDAAHGWDVAGALWAGMRAAFIAKPDQSLYPFAPAPEINVPDFAKLTDTLLA